MMSHSSLSAKLAWPVCRTTTRGTLSWLESADGAHQRPPGTARRKDGRMNRCRDIMRNQRLISPRVLKAKSLEPTLRLKFRRPIASRPYVRPRLAGKSKGLRNKPRGPLMQPTLQRPSRAVPPAVEANRLKLQTPVADALRRKLLRSKGELVEDFGLSHLDDLVLEGPTKSQERRARRARGRTRRTWSIGRTSTSAKWLGSSGPVESVPTG